MNLEARIMKMFHHKSSAVHRAKDHSMLTLFHLGGEMGWVQSDRKGNGGVRKIQRTGFASLGKKQGLDRTLNRFSLSLDGK